jgi:hypothetical protein
MNERIKELAEQANSYARSDNSSMLFENYQKRYTEKFAELIVEEYIREIGYKSVELLDIDFYPHYQERLKKHFGVGE